MGVSKEFNSESDRKAYLAKYAKKVAEASAKVDAAVADLQKFRVKAAVKVPEGFTKGAIDAFESHRKGQLKVCDDQDRRLAAARQRLKEVAALLK